MPPFRLKIERLEDACNVQKVIKFCDFITITGMVYKKKKKKYAVCGQDVLSEKNDLMMVLSLSF